MTTRVNRTWRLKKRPHGAIAPGDLDWHEEKLPALKDGEILVRNVYLSLDPTNRIWMSDADAYMPPVAIGEVMRGGTLGVVEESRDSSRAVGALVTGLGGWQDYYVGPARGMPAVKRQAGVPLAAHMSVLGMTGLTAYFGLTDIGAPREGETLVVSAAAGAVGSIAGQIGKLKGLRVVGIAGSDAKCRWLTEELGFDAAVNYKSEKVGARLDGLCPGGIDIDFENVGGEIFGEILARINLNARIVLCGLISQYNATERQSGPDNFANVLMKRATIKGFIVSDYAKRFAEGSAALGDWLAAGKLKNRVDVVDGLENAAAAVNRLFSGDNTGKLLVRVSPEP